MSEVSWPAAANTRADQSLHSRRELRPGAGLRDDLRAAVEKLHYVGHVEDVLIESGEEKYLVALQRPADGASDLLLAVVRLEMPERVSGAEGAIAQVVEGGAVQMI